MDRHLISSAFHTARTCVTAAVLVVAITGQSPAALSRASTAQADEREDDSSSSTANAVERVGNLGELASMDAIRVLPFKGLLTDNNGQAVPDGPYRLTFTLYADPDSNVPLLGWSEIHQAVAVRAGRFTALLGTIRSFDDPERISFASPVYLGVKVGDDSEMRPRKQIVPAVHAHTSTTTEYAVKSDDATHALDADKLGGQPSSFWMPPGSIIAYAGSEAPRGWLLCNGDVVNKADYPELWEAIRFNWGGNGNDMFNLPDLRGRFLRGVDLGAGLDEDRLTRGESRAGGNTGDAVGSIQAEQFRSHRHPITDPGHRHSVWMGARSGGNTSYTSNGDIPRYHTGVGTEPTTTGISVDSEGGNESRPDNANVTYIIKY